MKNIIAIALLFIASTAHAQDAATLEKLDKIAQALVNLDGNINANQTRTDAKIVAVADRVAELEARIAKLEAAPKAAAKRDCGCSFGGICRCGDVCDCAGDMARGKSIYVSAYQEARAKGLPVVVFVGTPARKIPGAVVCWVASFEDTTGPCVVVGRPTATWFDRYDLPRWADDATIRSTISPSVQVRWVTSQVSAPVQCST